MPPRIPNLTCLWVSKVAVPPNTFSLIIRSFTATVSPQAQKQKRKYQDPYVLAQARARKAANLSRQEILRKERTETLGDPVKGITTPFVESFDTGLPPKPEPTSKTESSTPKPEEKSHLNYFLNPSEVERAIVRSEQLAVLATKKPSTRKRVNDQFGVLTSIQGTDPAEDLEAVLVANHTRAATAIQRITGLENGSSKDRLHVNIQRCIEMFGRHNTDPILPPKPSAKLTPGADPAPTSNPAAIKRGGPDTGSSEVQIAILTAKIRTLAEFLQTRGKKDKANKRNLRLLVHRRQKLLQYLRRKERGGPRWQHCIEILGLTEGTWKGEISL